MEEGKIDLKDEVLVDDSDLDYSFGGIAEYYVPNSAMQIEDLLHQAIINSDNTATSVLLHSVNKGMSFEIYDELDIPIPEEDLPPSAITTQEYSKILKSLYYSSYLSPESSNEILKLMTEINKGEKLRADIPENIKIAHKIGFIVVEDEKKLSTYSDCGIIYAPNKPYLLCIIVQDDEKFTTQYMQHISNTVYNYINSLK